jgi:DNA mismatch endonuclease (patch repair protein)
MVDGCFWHGCPEHGREAKKNAAWWHAKIEANRRRDEDTDSLLHQAGWLVVRVWEHEDSAEAAERVAAALRERRSGWYPPEAPEPTA